MEKYKEVEDIGLLWEMVKMEITSLTTVFSKTKARCKQDEEKLLSSRLAQLSTKLQTAYSEDDKNELEQIKIKLSEIATERTRGANSKQQSTLVQTWEKITNISST